MKIFKIMLTGEFDGTHEIYVSSSVDLTNYEKHKELINKIIMKAKISPTSPKSSVQTDEIVKLYSEDMATIKPPDRRRAGILSVIFLAVLKTFCYN